MGVIEDTYADLDTDVSLEKFREAVEAKVEQMGGLADEETAAMLVAHELRDEEVNGIADIEPGMDEVKFVAKVTRVDEVRTFERDDEDRPEGKVLNAQVADETGRVRVAFWDEAAADAAENLSVGDVLRVAGRPTEGYSGLEVSVDKAEPADDVTVDADPEEGYRVEDLSLGVDDVDLQGVVLEGGSVRTFERDDGSEGRVSNVVLGDETGRIRVTLWDERADRAEELASGDTVEVVDGYVRERDGALELHVGNRGRLLDVDADVEFVPDATPIETLELDDTADVAGVVRSADPKRTFERDDGSEGQVRNVRLQDATGDVRVALWGEKADLDVGPGDELLVTDAEIQDGWQDDIEASAGWQASVVELESGQASAATADAGDDATDAAGGLAAFAGEGDADGAADTGAGDDEAGTAAATEPVPEGESMEFTGVVVQAGSPVILDDGEQTVSVETDADVTLGQELTVRGEMRDGRLRAEDVF
ncbi:MAG: single-stranded DNA binding protein [Halobacteriaceae archaeon]